jgi:hypothetical protein
MNLTELKAAAETAKASPAELELWQMEISPDDVLRLVEVASKLISWREQDPDSLSASVVYRDLSEALEGIEP